MPEPKRGRPKGSKTRLPTTKYKQRTRMVKKKHGTNCFKRWGKKGGNPILLEQRRKKQRRGK